VYPDTKQWPHVVAVLSTPITHALSGTGAGRQAISMIKDGSSAGKDLPRSHTGGAHGGGDTVTVLDSLLACLSVGDRAAGSASLLVCAAARSAISMTVLAMTADSLLCC